MCETVIHELFVNICGVYMWTWVKEGDEKGKRWDAVPWWTKIETARKNCRKSSGQGVECCQHPADPFSSSSSSNSQQKRALVFSYWSSPQPIRRRFCCFVISLWLRKALFACSVCGSLIKCQVSAASGVSPSSLWCDRLRFILINTIRWLQKREGDCCFLDIPASVVFLWERGL